MTDILSATSASLAYTNSKVAKPVNQEQQLSQQKAREAANEFEAVFLTQTFKEIFSTLGEEDPFDGPGQEIFREMLAGEYASSVAKSGGIGLSDEIYRQLISAQEV